MNKKLTKFRREISKKLEFPAKTNSPPKDVYNSLFVKSTRDWNLLVCEYTNVPSLLGHQPGTGSTVCCQLVECTLFSSVIGESDSKVFHSVSEM